MLDELDGLDGKGLDQHPPRLGLGKAARLQIEHRRLVEIADGGSAMLLEPTDVPAWAAALDTIEVGAVPPGMIEAARQRAQRFTWAGCADAVVTLMRSSHVG